MFAWLLFQPKLCTAALASSLALACSMQPAVVQLPPLGQPIPLHDLVTVYGQAAVAGPTVEKNILDTSLLFSTFEVEADVYVQICEDLLGEGGCFVPASAKYVVGLAADPDGTLCETIVQSLHDYWSRKDGNYREMHRSLPADKHAFLLPDGILVAYIRPETNRVGAQWLFYASGTALTVELVEFDRGVGALDSFVTDNLELALGRHSLRPTYKSFYPPNELLARLEGGGVRCPELSF